MASFGENLKRERELRGVDLHDMAESTKISFRFLQALEQDRVDVLPGGLFPRAFVRQYAKYLGLDPDRLVAEFVYAHGSGEDAAASSAAAPVRSRVEEAPVLDARRLVVGALVLLMVAFAAWQALRGRDEAVAESSPTPTPVQATPFPEDRVFPPPTSGGREVPVGAFALTITAVRNSWVDAKADGVTVINRVMQAGESQRIEAREVIGLSAGNAGGVQYAVDGRAGVPLGREGEVRRNVLFTPESLRTGGPAASPRPAPPRRPSPAASAPVATAPPDTAPSEGAPSEPSPPQTAPAATSSPAPTAEPSPDGH